MVLQSLPANAWLLWRFALQSHQFWLGTKSQKSRITQNNFKLITCKLSSIPLSCTIEKKISNTEEKGKRRCQKFVTSKTKSHPEPFNLIWWISQSNKNPSFPKEISDTLKLGWNYCLTFPTKKEKRKNKKVCVNSECQAEDFIALLYNRRSWNKCSAVSNGRNSELSLK